MTGTDARLEDFLARHPRVVHAEITRVEGSAPRDSGAGIFVAPDAVSGTIGGGRLEHTVIGHARRMLGQGTLRDALDLTLGPEIGQCCGGRVRITLGRMGQSDRQAVLARQAAADAAAPHVLVLGAGHVGRALAAALWHLPFRTILVDSRPGEIDRCAAPVETRLTPLPEAEIATAPPGSAFVVLTHDHGLDFLLTAAALQRGDAAYVGLIGSRTKLARFGTWCKAQDEDVSLAGLVCPIGAGGSRDKRPSVIAAFVAAEIAAALTADGVAGDTVPKPGPAPPAQVNDPARRGRG